MLNLPSQSTLNSSAVRCHPWLTDLTRCPMPMMSCPFFAHHVDEVVGVEV